MACLSRVLCCQRGPRAAAAFLLPCRRSSLRPCSISPGRYPRNSFMLYSVQRMAEAITREGYCSGAREPSCFAAKSSILCVSLIAARPASTPQSPRPLDARSPRPPCAPPSPLPPCPSPDPPFYERGYAHEMVRRMANETYRHWFNGGHAWAGGRRGVGWRRDGGRPRMQCMHPSVAAHFVTLPPLHTRACAVQAPPWPTTRLYLPSSSCTSTTRCEGGAGGWVQGSAGAASVAGHLDRGARAPYLWQAAAPGAACGAADVAYAPLA